MADANERRNAPSGTCPEGLNYDIPKIIGG